MDIEFHQLAPGTVEEHFQILTTPGRKTLEVIFTDEITPEIEKIHQKALEIAEGINSPDQKKAVLALIGQVHGLALETIEDQFTNKGGPKQALRNATTWHLKKEGIHAYDKNNIAILGPEEGPLLMPPPEKSENSETSDSTEYIESTEQLQDILLTTVESLLDPEANDNTLRALYLAISEIKKTCSNPFLQQETDTIQTKILTLISRSKNPENSVKETAKKTLVTLVEKIEVYTEKRLRERIRKAHLTGDSIPTEAQDYLNRNKLPEEFLPTVPSSAFDPDSNFETPSFEE